MSEQPPPHGLDPDLALGPDLAARGRPEPPAGRDGPARPPPPLIDPRPYRWALGGFALLLVIAFSVYQLSSHGLPTPGVPRGGRLHVFAAPLAASNLDGDANLAPPCTPARHDPRALNLCLLVHRGPLVLAFFATGSGSCERQVDALQSLAPQFAGTGVQFAAVAVRAGHAQAEALVRSRRWTIPVAYDRDGAVGGLYNVEICPLVELARPGGVVAERLIGEHWTAPAALATQVRTLAGR